MMRILIHVNYYKYNTTHQPTSRFPSYELSRHLYRIKGPLTSFWNLEIIISYLNRIKFEYHSGNRIYNKPHKCIVVIM